MKRFPKILVVLLMVTVVLVPMFISCDEETPAPPVDLDAQAKATFLSALKSAADYDADNISITVTGTDISIHFKNEAKDDDIEGAAVALVGVLRGLTDEGTELTIKDIPYKLHEGLAAFEIAMKNLFEGKDVSENYTAVIKFNNRSFSLEGTISVKDER